MKELGTEAGRELLTALPLNEWHPINREIVIEHILAIEAEATQGAAPRAEGLPVERLARAIKSRYGLKESESEVSIFLNAIFGSGEAGHD